MNWLQQDLIFQTTWTINHKHIQQTHYQVVSRDQKTTLSTNVEMLLSVDTEAIIQYQKIKYCGFCKAHICAVCV